jgi:hypothetical protein
LPDDLPEGWDLADPIPDGMDPKELVRLAKHAPAPAIATNGLRLDPARSDLAPGRRG